MKNLILIVGIVLLHSLSGDNGSLPSIAIKTLEGNNADLSEIDNNGKPIILCFWELSCKPCLLEFDNISKKYKEWQDETGVKVVAISVDDNRNYNRVKPFVKSKGWPFEFYQDPNQESKRALGIPNCPATLVLNGAKQIVWRKTTYTQGDEYVIYDMVKKLSRGETVEE